MRTAVWLAQLALWTSSSHAFFPFDPDWHREAREASGSAYDRRAPSIDDAIDARHGLRFEIKQRETQSNSPVHERAANAASRLIAKYASRQADDTRDDLTKRANNFRIVEAKDPKMALTEGIDQDGTDYSYFVQVQLGSKKHKMYMLVDTGAGSSWVMGSDCNTDACKIHNTFGPNDSDTMNQTNKDFSIAYGSGKVSGKLVKDTLSIAGLTVDYMFGLADQTSDQFVQFAFDGILGLSPSSGASDNFIETLVKAGKIDKKMFCIVLNRASDGDNTGHITFGSTNKDMYTGDISYTPLIKDDDWSIKLDDFGYDGKKGNLGGVTAYIDTGTSYIFGPGDAVKSLHSAVPGAESSDGVTFTVPCDTDKNMTVTFSGVQYQISSKDWVAPKNKDGKCSSNIYGHEVVKGAWLLGDTFLKNVYSVFDKDQKRIGFASRPVPSQPEKPKSETETTTASPTTGDTPKQSETDSGSGKPDARIGHESAASASGTAAGSESTNTKDSASSHQPIPSIYLVSFFSVATFFGVVAA